MDRLTDKRFVGDGFYQPKNREERLEIFLDIPPLIEIYSRLAEYEDTGMTPEKVKNMKIHCENTGCIYYGENTLEQSSNIEAEHDNGWISVKDRLPENDGKYMVWYKGEWDVCEFDVDSKTFGFTYDDYDEMNLHLVCWDDGMDKYVTHWRPLPDPPKEG